MSDFDVEAFTLLALAVVAIGIRIAARWTTAGPKNFQLDDYLMPLAGVFPLATLTFATMLRFRSEYRSCTASKPELHTASAHGGAASPTTQ
jgi:hypothetical protein